MNPRLKRLGTAFIAGVIAVIAVIRRAVSSPWLWATLYVLMVPGFALWYARLPGGSFHQAHPQHDSDVIALRDSLVNSMLGEMRVNARAAYDTTLVSHNGWITDLDRHVLLRDIRAEEGRWLDADMIVVTRPEGDTAGVSMGYQFMKLRIPLDIRWGGGSAPGRWQFTCLVENSAGFPVPIQKMFPYDYVTDGTWPAEGVMFPVTRSLGQEMIHYHDARSGRTERVPGHYRRMLYLSAVTVTTLGFGDIVPTSPRARDLIAAEAASGVVVLGVFISTIALGMRVRGRDGKGSPPPN